MKGDPGDPFRAIASLELIGVLAAVMVFSPGAEGATGESRVTMSALTDNLANAHVLRKFVSNKYPLSIIAINLASQLDRLGLELDLQWVPRWQNQPADDEDFAEDKRLKVDFETLGFIVLDRRTEAREEVQEGPDAMAGSLVIEAGGSSLDVRCFPPLVSSRV